MIWDLAQLARVSVFDLADRPIAAVLALSNIVQKRAAREKKNKPAPRQLKPPDSNTIRNPMARGMSREVHSGNLNVLKTKAGFKTIRMDG